MITYWEFGWVVFLQSGTLFFVFRYIFELLKNEVESNKQDIKIIERSFNKLHEDMVNSFVPSEKIDKNFKEMLLEIRAVSNIVSKLSRDFHEEKGFAKGVRSGKS